MLLTLNQTDRAKYKIVLKTPKKICADRDKERAECKKAETITYGIFDSFADAERASNMFVYGIAYFKDNPDVLKEPLFLEKNFKVGDKS